MCCSESFAANQPFPLNFALFALSARPQNNEQSRATRAQSIPVVFHPFLFFQFNSESAQLKTRYSFCIWTLCSRFRKVGIIPYSLGVRIVRGQRTFTEYQTEYLLCTYVCTLYVQHSYRVRILTYFVHTYSVFRYITYTLYAGQAARVLLATPKACIIRCPE